MYRKEEENILPLIKKCIQNNKEAQKNLYKLFYNYSLKTCSMYATNRDEAVEIMNDGFLKAFKYMKKYDQKKSFKPWLKTIMIHSGVDFFNKNKKRNLEVDLTEAMNESVDESVLDSISYDEVLEMIQKLPDAYRTVFNLVAIEGYTHREVAEMLGIREGTSKSNYARAKYKLQEYLNLFFEIEK